MGLSMIWPMSGSKGPSFILTSVFFMIANLYNRIAKISLKMVLVKHITVQATIISKLLKYGRHLSSKPTLHVQSTHAGARQVAQFHLCHIFYCKFKSVLVVKII